MIPDRVLVGVWGIGMTSRSFFVKRYNPPQAKQAGITNKVASSSSFKKQPAFTRLNDVQHALIDVS